MADALITHAFVSPYLDGPDPTKLQPSHQNAPLVVSGGAPGEMLVADPASSTGAAFVPVPPAPDLSGLVLTGDARLSDARTPLTHTHAFPDLTSKPTTLAGYGITNGVLTSDARLSDARTPVAHTHPFADLTGQPVARFPLFVESFASFFRGTTPGQPSGIANLMTLAAGNGGLTVSGAAGASVLTITGVQVGALADYGGLWPGVIAYADGTYECYNLTALDTGASTIGVFPALSRAVSGVTLSNLWDSVNSQHMTLLGYTAFAAHVYRAARATVHKLRYADTHGWLGSYFTTAWQYGAEIGATFTLMGGATQGGFAGSVALGIANATKALSNGAANRYTGADRSLYHTTTMTQTQVGVDAAGEGVTRSAALGGASGYFESFVGIESQRDAGTEGSPLRVKLTIDGVLVVNRLVTHVERIVYPFVNATTSVFTVTAETSAAVQFAIGQTTWWTHTAAEAAALVGPLIPPTARVVVYADSWGVYHTNTFVTKLAALMTADAGGGSVTVINASLGGRTAAQATATYDALVAPSRPDVVIIDYSINDNAGLMKPWEFHADLARLIARILASGAIPLVVSPNRTGSDTQSGTLSGLWAEVANVPIVPGIPEAAVLSRGDVALTLTSEDRQTILYELPLTVNRVLTLPSAALYAGQRLRVVRLAASTGAFTVDVKQGATTLRSLPPAAWCDAEYTGRAWIIAAAGSLT